MRLLELRLEWDGEPGSPSVVSIIESVLLDNEPAALLRRELWEDDDA